MAGHPVEPHTNHEKRLRWALENLGASFVIHVWCDETLVKLETDQRLLS